MIPPYQSIRFSMSGTFRKHCENCLKEGHRFKFYESKKFLHKFKNIFVAIFFRAVSSDGHDMPPHIFKKEVRVNQNM